MSVVLRIRDEEFQCRRISVTWQLMCFVKAQQKASKRRPERFASPDAEQAFDNEINEAGMQLLATMYDTVMVLLKPEERDRFVDYMATAELEAEELENAIGDAVSQLGGDDPGKAGEALNSVSSESASTTSENSRVVSFAGAPSQPLPEET